MKHFLLFALTLLFFITACKSTEPQSNAPSGPKNIAQMIEDRPDRAESYTWIDESEHNDVWILVDEPPALVNGMRDFQQRVSRTVAGNSSADCDKLSGERVIYRFVIDKEGSISKIKSLLEEPNECSELVEMTIRSIKFTPGKVNGEPVSVAYAVPVTF